MYTEFGVCGSLCYNIDIWCTRCCAPRKEWQYKWFNEVGGRELRRKLHD